MAKTHQRLKVLSVPRLKTAGYHADGDGLYLQVTTGEAKSWIYRFALAGRRREMGLGPYPAVTLAAARLVASEARALAQAGKDPIGGLRV